MSSVEDLVRSLWPNLSGLDDQRSESPFSDLGIDSFDLMAFRVDLEKTFACEIPDETWLSFKNFDDIRAYFYNRSSDSVADVSVTRMRAQRNYLVNMPQMAAGGLSENWLFKEVGDLHWMMICKALGSPSHAILDSRGNRLYATFVRLRLELTEPLSWFVENEELSLSNQLSRYGKSMFFSECEGKTPTKGIRASMMSTFALRESAEDNRSLLRGEPKIPDDSDVTALTQRPPFAEQYRDMRRGALREVQMGGETFIFGGRSVFEMDYTINPYTDFNGVNLLYFAAYPLIHDFCERAYIRDSHRKLKTADWSSEVSTLARDVFYYGNCRIDDTIVYRIHALEWLPKGRFKISSSLSRKSDGAVLAELATLKATYGD